MSELTVSNVGQAIRRLRQSRNLSLAELADRLGWDKGRLSKYENDRLRLSLPVIEEIAHAFDERPEVVLLFCIKHRYPQLSLKGSKTGKLLNKLLKKMAE